MLRTGQTALIFFLHLDMFRFSVSILLLQVLFFGNGGKYADFYFIPNSIFLQENNTQKKYENFQSLSLEHNESFRRK